jgi:hypothetical protein
VDFGGIDITRTSEADVRQYCFVKKGSAAGSAIITAASGTDMALGVAQEAVSAAEGAAGKSFAVRVSGTTKAVNGTSGALAEGVAVMCDASGKIIAQSGPNTFTVGITLEAATALNDVISIILTNNGTKNNA